MKVRESEFKAIKKYLKTNNTMNAARIMQRSMKTILLIDNSKNYEAYKEIIKAEHTAKKPRQKLSVQLHNAKVNELLAIRSRGRFGAYNAACKRLQELGL